MLIASMTTNARPSFGSQRQTSPMDVSWHESFAEGHVSGTKVLPGVVAMT